MVSEQRFTCQECGEQFVIKGTWYNQWFYSRWGNLRFYLHCVRTHKNKLKKRSATIKILKEVVIISLLVILTIILKIIWVITFPFALINSATS